MRVGLLPISCLLICSVITTHSIAETTIYDRPFHLTYSNDGGKALEDLDEDILAAFASMPVRPTMALQVILNKLDLSKGSHPPDAFVRAFKELVPNMCFGAGQGKNVNNGLGADLQNQADWDWYMQRAAAWSQYTDCISLEAFDLLVDNAPESVIVSFLTELHDTYGFNHIVANPWRPSESGQAWPHIDGAWIGIRQVDGDIYEKWHPRVLRAETIMANNPSIRVMMNYENAPGHIALADLGNEGSCEAMQIAVDDQKASDVDFYWAPPWTSNYDPLVVGSWDWIKEAYQELYGPGSAAGVYAGVVAAGDAPERVSSFVGGLGAKSLISFGFGVIVGIWCLLIVWGVGVCYCRRRKKECTQEDDSDHEAEETDLL